MYFLYKRAAEIFTNLPPSFAYIAITKRNRHK